MFVIGRLRVHILWPVIRPEWVSPSYHDGFCDSRGPTHPVFALITSQHLSDFGLQRKDDTFGPLGTFLWTVIFHFCHCRTALLRVSNSGYLIGHTAHIYMIHIPGIYYISVYICMWCVRTSCVRSHIIPYLVHMIHGGIHSFFLIFCWRRSWFSVKLWREWGCISPPTCKRILFRSYWSIFAGREQASFWWSK